MAVFSLLFVARTAHAHTIGLSRGEYDVEGSRVTGRLTVGVDDAVLATADLHTDPNGQLRQREIERSMPALRAAFFDTLAVEADGRRCLPHFEDASVDGRGEVHLQATYACSSLSHRLHLHFGFLDRMPSDHRHLATVHLPMGRGGIDSLATLARPDMDLDLDSQGASPGFPSLLRAGIEHILVGWDHLAFLLALVLGTTSPEGRAASTRLPGKAIRSLVAMLTAFTVGHSASLAIATLGGFAPSARWVEPAVALSVAYVGVENVLGRAARRRWMLTLPFGVIHGFAFAGALLPLGLPRRKVPAALLAFNLGVEAGQLVVLGGLLVLVALLRSRPWYPRMARGMSFGIALLGVAWFFQRV